MKWVGVIAGLVAIFGTSQAAIAAPPKSEVKTRPIIHIEDVSQFYKIYDAANGHPSAQILQHKYIDTGSPGLHRLAKLRHVTGGRIAKNITAHPDAYMTARRCTAVLPAVRQRLQRALVKFHAAYPGMTPAPVTIAIGRGKPVGVTDKNGVMIGLEALCAINYLDANVEDRFVHVITHEYAHVQQAVQSPKIYNDKNPTVLETSLIEGAAEFTAELFSGSVAYVDLKALTKGREKAIETKFARDENKTDLSDWLYNGTLTKPGDLGYWAGYRIVKAYYQHTPDKRRALRDILEMKDPKMFLAKSGWYPGIKLR